MLSIPKSFWYWDGHLDRRGGDKKKKNNLFPFLSSILNPLLPSALYPRVCSIQAILLIKHIVPTKDSKSSQWPCTPAISFFFFPLHTKVTFLKPVASQNILLKMEKAVSWLAVCTTTSSKIYYTISFWIIDYYVCPIFRLDNPFYYFNYSKLYILSNKSISFCYVFVLDLYRN